MTFSKVNKVGGRKQRISFLNQERQLSFKKTKLIPPTPLNKKNKPHDACQDDGERSAEAAVCGSSVLEHHRTKQTPKGVHGNHQIDAHVVSCFREEGKRGCIVACLFFCAEEKKRFESGEKGGS